MVTLQTPSYVRPTARWKAPRAAGSAAADLASSLGVSRLVAAVLVERGFTDPEEARTFLRPDLGLLHDPFLMCGMEAAVSRVRDAILRNEPILIYGDYDVDGTTSVVILKKTIEILGGRADFHIPHRVREGYGMRNEVVESAAAAGIRLIVSVDTGIRAKEVVDHARTLAVDVIVTDHHLPDAELPAALAILNPNQPDCEYPCKQLCGAGVTLKLVQGLLERSELAETRRRALLDSFLKPVAIATVADIVPLTGENRVIVRRGLSGLRDVRNPGLRALLEVSGFREGQTPSAHQVGFRLAPRINAAGRMAAAQDVVRLFLTGDRAEAQRIAEQLDLLNRERQQAEREIVDSILQQCQEQITQVESAALVFAAPDWHLGVLGIVASRLAERFCRPVFVLGTTPAADGDVPCWTGSGRSIPAFHLLEALESMGDLFLRFGGHWSAAGLTLRDENLEVFRQRFHEFAAQLLSDEQRRPEYQADAEIGWDQLTDDTVEELGQLGPFGFGNPAPLFLARGAELAGPPRVLSGGKHLTLPLRQAGKLQMVKAWNLGERLSSLQVGHRYDVLVQVEDDDYGRQRGLAPWCLSAKDLRGAE